MTFFFLLNATRPNLTPLNIARPMRVRELKLVQKGRTPNSFPRTITFSVLLFSPPHPFSSNYHLQLHSLPAHLINPSTHEPPYAARRQGDSPNLPAPASRLRSGLCRFLRRGRRDPQRCRRARRSPRQGCGRWSLRLVHPWIAWRSFKKRAGSRALPPPQADPPPFFFVSSSPLRVRLHQAVVSYFLCIYSSPNPR